MTAVIISSQVPLINESKFLTELWNMLKEKGRQQAQQVHLETSNPTHKKNIICIIERGRDRGTEIERPIYKIIERAERVNEGRGHFMQS